MEHEEQKAFVMWANKHQRNIKELAMLYAIPNAGKRNAVVASYMISEGLKAGVPDLFLASPVGQYHGLYIEFKFGRGKLSDRQGIWKKKLEDRNYAYHVFYSWQAAIRGTLFYLDGQFPRKD